MLNVAAIVGRLTADPEVKQTGSGISVMSFTVATSRSYAKAGTKRQTDFIDCVAWRGTAEFIAKYFRKGDLIGVHGSIQTRTYQDKNGNNRKATEVYADGVEFVTSRKDSDSGATEPTQGGYGGNASNYSAGGQNGYTAAQAQKAGYSQGSFEDFATIPADEDLPF